MTKPSVTYSGPLPGTIIATKYDRLSTLPYLQLAGWSQREAIFIVLFMVAMYFGYAYISANLVSIEPMRQSEFLTNKSQYNVPHPPCRVLQRGPAEPVRCNQ